MTAIADYLTRFAAAVVPREDFTISYDQNHPHWLEISLNEGKDLNFNVVDTTRRTGAIFYFADIKIPTDQLADI